MSLDINVNLNSTKETAEQDQGVGIGIGATSELKAAINKLEQSINKFSSDVQEVNRKQVSRAENQIPPHIIKERTAENLAKIKVSEQKAIADTQVQKAQTIAEIQQSKFKERSSLSNQSQQEAHDKRMQIIQAKLNASALTHEQKKEVAGVQVQKAQTIADIQQSNYQRRQEQLRGNKVSAVIGNMSILDQKNMDKLMSKVEQNSLFGKPFADKIRNSITSGSGVADGLKGMSQEQMQAMDSMVRGQKMEQWNTSKGTHYKAALSAIGGYALSQTIQNIGAGYQLEAEGQSRIATANPFSSQSYQAVNSLTRARQEQQANVISSIGSGLTMGGSMVAMANPIAGGAMILAGAGAELYSSSKKGDAIREETKNNLTSAYNRTDYYRQKYYQGSNLTDKVSFQENARSLKPYSYLDKMMAQNVPTAKPKPFGKMVTSESRLSINELAAIPKGIENYSTMMPILSGRFRGNKTQTENLLKTMAVNEATLGITGEQQAKMIRALGINTKGDGVGLFSRASTLAQGYGADVSETVGNLSGLMQTSAGAQYLGANKTLDMVTQSNVMGSGYQAKQQSYLKDSGISQYAKQKVYESMYGIDYSALMGAKGQTARRQQLTKYQKIFKNTSAPGELPNNKVMQAQMLETPEGYAALMGANPNISQGGKAPNYDAIMGDKSTQDVVKATQEALRPSTVSIESGSVTINTNSLSGMGIGYTSGFTPNTGTPATDVSQANSFSHMGKLFGG